MAYLEVIVERTPGGYLASSANGCSLGKSSGCLAFFIGTRYPSLVDYIEGLEYEGWYMVSSQTSQSFGVIDGLPFGFSGGTLLFRGSGRYKIEWIDDRWQFVGSRLE